MSVKTRRSHGQGGVKAVFADDIPCQAGEACKSVAVGFFAFLAASDNVGPVGHLQNVGHVTGGEGIQNGRFHV